MINESNPEIVKVLVLSTAHITVMDAVKLSTRKGHSGKDTYRFWVHVENLLSNSEEGVYSESLQASLQRAQSLDCKFVCFDRDGNTLDDLEKHNW